MKIKFGLLMMAACIATAFSQENYATWSGNTTIAINTTSSGANVAGTLTNFPLLVRLTVGTSNVFSQAAADGSDIRFTDSTGTTRLKHEKERWNAASRTAEFWVLVPSIAGNAITTIRMYWGKPGAADSSSSAATFSRANNFLGVWHMGNPANASAPETSPRPNAVNPGTNDATPYVNATPGFNSGYTVTTGQIGLADTLVGGSTGTGGGSVTPGAYLDLGAISDTGYANFSNGLTLSLWARISSAPNPSTSAYTRLIEINNGFNMNTLTLDRSNNTTALRYELNSNATGQTGTAANYWLADDAYHHIALTVSGTTATLYLDGVPAASTTLTAALQNIQRTMGRLGCGTAAVDRESFTGALDEVEVSNVNRSADWIKMSYATQMSGGAAVLVPIKPVVSKSIPEIQTLGSAVLFRLPEGLSGARITIVDLQGRSVWNQTFSAGTREISWNGKTEGRSFPAGIYIVRLTNLDPKPGILAEGKIALTP